MEKFIEEMKNIRKELDTIRGRTRTLKSRYIVLERQVINMLNEEKLPGVKYNDHAITINDKEKKLMVSKKNQRENITRILETNGVSNPKEVYSQIENSKVRERLHDVSLKFNKLKNKK